MRWRNGLVLLLLAALVATSFPVAAQPLPDGEFYGEQQFDPTVEILLATGNGLLAGYNGYLLLRGKRRHFVAGAAVILGSIGIAIGMRDGANYPTADLAFGGLAVAAGAAQLISYYAPGGAWGVGRRRTRARMSALPIRAPGSSAWSVAISVRLSRL